MVYMTRPKMIIFDYGHTICYEPGFDGVRGNEAVMKLAVKNKMNLSAAEVSAFADNFYNGIGQIARDMDIEVKNLISERFMYEYLQIGFDLPPGEVERVFWDNASPGATMPNIDKVLDYLKKNGIRSGVISNISFSGENLKNRIDGLLPDNEFEFIIASSEYVFRKPNKMIFELALRKAELSAEDVWYCGDNTKCDVAGAAGAGIFPVWFHSNLDCDYREKALDVRPEQEHLYIREWLELIEALENIAVL